MTNRSSQVAVAAAIDDGIRSNDLSRAAFAGHTSATGPRERLEVGLMEMGSAFDFACQFLQSCRIRRAGNQGAQLRGNFRGSVLALDRLRFCRWYYLAFRRRHRTWGRYPAAAQ